MLEACLSISLSRMITQFKDRGSNKICLASSHFSLLFLRPFSLNLEIQESCISPVFACPILEQCEAKPQRQSPTNVHRLSGQKNHATQQVTGEMGATRESGAKEWRRPRAARFRQTFGQKQQQKKEKRPNQPHMRGSARIMAVKIIWGILPEERGGPPLRRRRRLGRSPAPRCSPWPRAPRLTSPRAEIVDCVKIAKNLQKFQINGVGMGLIRFSAVCSAKLADFSLKSRFWIQFANPHFDETKKNRNDIFQLRLSLGEKHTSSNLTNMSRYLIQVTLTLRTLSQVPEYTGVPPGRLGRPQRV